MVTCPCAWCLVNEDEAGSLRLPGNHALSVEKHKGTERRTLFGFVLQCLSYVIGRQMVVQLPACAVLSKKHQSPLPWQSLNFLPLPQGQGSLRPGALSFTMGWRDCSRVSC